MDFTIQISLGVNDGCDYCFFEIAGISSDELISTLSSLEDSIASILDSKFNLEVCPDD